MVVLAVLKWVIVAIVGLFAILFFYFLIFPKSRDVADVTSTKISTEKSSTAAKALSLRYDQIPDSVVFETKHNESGKLTVVDMIERRAKGGTVLVIPLVPVPLTGEKQDVKIRYFYYTQKDGRSRRLGDVTTVPHRTDILDAFFFKENPLRGSGDFIFQLDPSFADQLRDIAECILQNKKDLESFLGQSIAAIAVIKKRDVAPDMDILFFDPRPDLNDEFAIGFEYSGTDFSELNIVYRLKDGDHFKDYNYSLGEIFVQDHADLLTQIPQLSADYFVERKFPNPPAVQGVQYRLYSTTDRVPQPDAQQVFQALKKLPTMRSEGAGESFADYYAKQKDLLENPKHYLKAP